MSVTWDVLLDLDRDGIPEYNVRNDVISVAWGRGRKFYLDSAPPGDAQIVLDNVDRKYNRGNTASVIYPDFQDGILVELRGTVSGTTYTVFHGYIVDIDARPTPREQTALLQCLDISYRLQRSKRYVGPILRSYYDGYLVRELCRAYGMREQDILVDTGLDSVPVMAFGRSSSLAQYIDDVREGAQGFFYVNGAGQAVYEDRCHRLRDDHLTSQYTFVAYDVIDTQRQDRSQQVINHAIITASPRTEQVESEVYSLSQPRRISPGEVLSLWCDYSSQASSWATNIVTPVATTDYLANLTFDGTGTDRTASLTLLGFCDKSMSALVQIHSGDSLPVWLTKLVIRGRPLSVLDNFPEEYAWIESIHNQGEGIKSLSPDTMQSRGQARDFAEYIVSTRQARGDTPDVVLPIVADGDDTLAEQLLARELSDRVTVQVGVADLNQDFHIEELHCQVQQRGASFVGTYRLLPAAAPMRLFRLDADAGSPSDSGGLDIGLLVY